MTTVRFRPPVAHLLRMRRPSAVLRRVRPVVVDALDRVLGWTRSHVCEKRIERLAPAVTDCDTASAVELVIASIRIQAARLHGLPRAVFACALIPDAGAVLRATASHSVNRETATTARLAVEQFLRVDVAHGATIATTRPSSQLVDGWGRAQNQPSAEATSDKIDAQDRQFYQLTTPSRHAGHTESHRATARAEAACRPLEHSPR